MADIQAGSVRNLASNSRFMTSCLDPVWGILKSDPDCNHTDRLHVAEVSWFFSSLKSLVMNIHWCSKAVAADWAFQARRMELVMVL